MKTKHTPGPWKVLEIKNDKELMFIVKSDERMIGSFHGFYSDADDKLKADANLLAAAPEMLEALENALRLLAVAENNNAFKDCALPLIGKKTIEQIESIINKAKGE